MLPKLIINGKDFTGLIAREGLVQTDIVRQSRTIVTLDGVEHRAGITKRQIDVTLTTMRLSRFVELVEAITQPSSVTYFDRVLGEITKTFWVDGLSDADQKVDAGEAFVDQVTFSLVER